MQHASAVFLAVIAVELCAVTAACAEIRVEGTRDALQVSTGGEPVADVFSTLGRAFGITYRSAIPLDAPASETYSGTLLEVTSRLLERYNYVLKRNQDETEIIIVGKRGATSAAPVRTTPAKSNGVTSRWR